MLTCMEDMRRQDIKQKAIGFDMTANGNEVDMQV